MSDTTQEREGGRSPEVERISSEIKVQIARLRDRVREARETLEPRSFKDAEPGDGGGGSQG